MIIIRNDDVLLSSSRAEYSNAFERFKHVHEVICRSDRFLHVPAILTEEIQEFPEAIAYIQQETAQGRMKPQLHGLRHIDYGQLSEEEVSEHLLYSCGWFIDNLGYLPTKWYTPWGANQPHLHSAAEGFNMKAIDCSNTIKFKGRYGVTQLLSEGKEVSYFDKQEIIMHWWSALDVERLTLLVDKANEVRTTD